MKITLDLTTDEAITLRDALIDKSIELRSDARGVAMNEAKFYADPLISERRKKAYTTLREYAETLRRAIR